MGRFLVVVPPMAGHVNPTIPVGAELAARGHEVAWCGPREVVAELLPPDVPFLPVPLLAALGQAIRARAADRRGLAALKHLVGEFLVPLAHDMLPGVRAAVDGFEPDVMLVDQQALAGTAVAEAAGVPWATSATTSVTLYDQLALLPKVQRWADDLQRGVLRAAGLDEDRARRLDLRFSPHLVLVFSTGQLVGLAEHPDHYVFVGPALGERHDPTPFEWTWLDHDGPTVLVSLGTLNGHNGGPFLTAASRALGGLERRGVRGIVVAPPGVGPVAGREAVGQVPPNVLVTPRVPQLRLLPHLDAVVCHAGHNTVCEALAHGVPLVLAPIRDDQPAVAEQVVRSGAGVRVPFRRATAAGLAEAVETVLDDAGVRAAAQRVQASFAAAGGADTAADQLERLAARHATGATAQPSRSGGAAAEGITV